MIGVVRVASHGDFRPKLYIWRLKVRVASLVAGIPQTTGQGAAARRA